jgi:integrase
MPTYLFRRNGTYYFRFVIPSAERHRFNGRREIRRSLKTYDRQLAQLQAYRLYLDMTHDITHLTIIEKNGVKVSIHRKNPSEEAQIASSILGGTNSTAKNGENITLSKLVAEYVEEKKRETSWTDKTEHENRAIYDLLVRIIGDVNLDNLNSNIARYYKKTLLKLPPNINKNPRLRQLSIEEIIDLKFEKVQAVNTINKHLNRASSLFGWAVKNGYLEHNHFESLQLKKTKRDDEEREVFSPEDLRKLFKQREKYRHPYYYWLPYLGLYTGARIEELCQLYCEDIRQENSIWVFDINALKDKKLKKPHCKRLIPVHSRLISLGFIEFAKTPERERLFPELRKGRDGYSQAASKWFNGRYRPIIGVKPPFHSFRHTFDNALKQALVEPPVMNAILGHANNNIGLDRYGKPYGVEILRNAIEILDFTHLRLGE